MNIIIIEPHYDDAWINLGGFILKNPQINYKIVSICSSNKNNKLMPIRMIIFFKFNRSRVAIINAIMPKKIADKNIPRPKLISSPFSSS